MIKKAIYVLLLLLAAFVGFYIGRNTVTFNIGTTFYATIEEINGDSLMVSGLEVNDINSRGWFRFTMDDKTALEWRHTEITVADLHVGDIISVTYVGAVRESDPAGIDSVLKIQLLEDEK